VVASSEPGPQAAEGGVIRPLADRAFEGVLARLMSGQIRPGSVIQERRLAETLGLSRSPVHDAVARLEGRGLLVRQASGTLTVRTVSLAEALQALQLALLVEPESLGRGDARADPDLLARIGLRLDALDPYGERPGLAMAAINLELHVALAATIGPRHAARLVEDLHRDLVLFALDTTRRVAPAEIAATRALVEAAGAGPSEAVAEAAARQLAELRAGHLAAL